MQTVPWPGPQQGCVLPLLVHPDQVPPGLVKTTLTSEYPYSLAGGYKVFIHNMNLIYKTLHKSKIANHLKYVLEG